ncbi:MAG: M20/M25/M40 family metallo-hydrolase [Clostridia bacterium]|nr:M20/M25/M40 family metallo-hydrolase [Clostridia bacterium]
MEELNIFIKQNEELMYKTLKELCLIPAPSHKEHMRAEYCKNWLESFGAKDVHIDDALNVIFPINCDSSSQITVFAAHTDTVFPDTEPMPYSDDGEKIFCPGVADDTACVVTLMLTAKYFIENSIVPEGGIMFVCNSCEEGLGNLKGTKQLFTDYSGRIKQFITFDNQLDQIADHCVGSHRYEVEVLTEGGHSFGDFGKINAIAELSKIVSQIYSIQVPTKGNSVTTYNVGTIEGGTSVNTIAQSAKMLCEYRSDNHECLAIMQEKFEAIFASCQSDKVKVNVTKVGDRPCANIDFNKVETLKQIVVPIIENIVKKDISCCCMSTDCNVPLSLGVPALCIGTNTHGGIHTREEWLEKDSLIPGQKIAIETALALTKAE